MFPIIYSVDFDMGRHNKKERKSYLKRMKRERKLASNSCDKILEIIIASAEVDHKIENEYVTGYLKLMSNKIIIHWSKMRRQKNHLKLIHST